MVNPAIKVFFAERKEAWLKKNLKSSMEESEVREKQLKCEEVFSPETWFPNAAKRAGQMSLATHPCTFSHPSARKNKNGYATPVIVDAGRISDGYLRSEPGNKGFFCGTKRSLAQKKSQIFHGRVGGTRETIEV